MNGGFKKLSSEINFTISKSFEEVKVVNANLKENSIFHIEFSSLQIIPFEEMKVFLTNIRNFKYRINFSFDVVGINYERNNVLNYLEFISKEVIKNDELWPIILRSDLKINNNEAHLWIVSQDEQNKVEEVKNEIERIMQKFGFKDFSLETHVAEIHVNLDDEKTKLISRAQESINSVSNTNENTNNKNFNGSPSRYNNSKQFVSISEIPNSQLNQFTTQGKIFTLDKVVTKNGLIICSMAITDYRNALYVKYFAFSEKEKAFIDTLQIGQTIKVHGNYAIDSYNHEPTMTTKQIEIVDINEEIQKEIVENKRIELGARTNMSIMDGIVNPTDLVKRVAQLGQEAVAIVDTSSVQSFPEFYSATKKYKIKGIYGATINMLSRLNGAIHNIRENLDLYRGKYIVFDLETTGLSSHYEDIIEFGAVKVENGTIVDKKQFFIKPNKPISETISKLTSITNEDVENAMSELEGINAIKEYIADYTLVAHNANFDISFINSKLVKYGYKELSNTWIDSLVVAKITLKDSHRFSLGYVAKKYYVEYDELVAHRADYDANVLAQIWNAIINDLTKEKIIKYQDLANYQDSNLYQKTFKYEATIIAKNQQGLKELFKIISLSHTDFFFKEPTFFWEEVTQFKNILIGSGALKSKLIDYLFFGTRKQVIKEIEKYDYIEIQPPRNFIHYKNKGFTQEQIEDGLTFLINESKRQGKIVVVTGDVRYLDDDQICHEILISSKGLGGSSHYLFDYQNKEGPYPKQNFLGTMEMKGEMAFLNDYNLIEEIVVTNSNKIANMIEEIQVIKDKLYTPSLPDADEKLTQIVYENAHAKYGENIHPHILARIEKELVPIKKYGFSVIYWIAHILVDKSLRDGYLVGSRGSVGSSLVATLANITEVNPLEPHYICKSCKYIEFILDSKLNSGFDLPNKECPKCQTLLDKDGQSIPFETFLGFEANKTPDIDLNFSGEYQPIIHNEARDLFGHSHTFRAGTISKLALRTAFGYVKAWVESTNKQFSKAFIEFLTQKLVGVKRTTGQHPGGIIVIPKEFDVEDFTPINFPANDTESSWKTTHFDFEAIHDNVLKLDLLGHDDPTAIRMLEKLTGVDARKDITFNDPKIISLFSSPLALGIKPSDINNEKTGAMGLPEFGTSFVRKMLQKVEVKSFGDLISISGLSHGTDVWTNNAEEIIAKEGKTLDQVISCRDDIMNDLVAKGLDALMSFKIMEQVRKGKSITEEQEKILKENNVEDWYVESLKKIKYMFPKAHATAYVMMAWRIAWFKLYRPLEYYATYLSTRTDVFDIETVIAGKTIVENKLKHLLSVKHVTGEKALSNKEQDLIPILEIVNEANARGIKISNLDLKRSLAKDWVIDYETKSLIPPFIALDGLGIAVAVSIVNARSQGEFLSIDDFQKRTSINKTVLQKLIDLNVLKNLNKSSQISLF